MNFFAASKENKYKSMPKILLFICVYFIFSFGATAIEADDTESNFDLLLNHTNYVVADGLSQDTVTAIVEDHEGYVWIGTINGLNRFDGNEFKQFYAVDGDQKSLPSSFIRNLIINKNGELLIGTDKGLVTYEQDTGKFIKHQLSNLIGEQAIWAISEQNNEILIGLKNRIISYDTSTKKIGTDLNRNEFSEVKKIIKLKKSIFLRNYDGDVYEVNNDIVSKVIARTNDITLMNDSIVAVTDTGVYIINGNKKTISNLNIKTLDLINNFSSPYRFGVQGNILYQLELINEKLKVKKIGTLNINKERLNNIFITKTNNHVYLSNFIDGYFDISKKKNYLKKINIPDNNVWSMAKIKEGILVADNESNLNFYNKNLKLIKNEIKNLNHGPKSILTIGDNIFIGTSDGLVLKNNITKSNKKLLTDIIFNIRMYDDIVYASTFDGKIYR